MRVKRFTGKDMREAISKVKAEFGEAAVILHTKKVRKPGWRGLFGARETEVVAALDGSKPTARLAGIEKRRKTPVETAGDGDPAADKAAGSVHMELRGLRAEMSELKRLLGTAHRSLAGRAAGDHDWPPSVTAVYDKLVQSGVDPDIAQRIVEQVWAGVLSSEAEPQVEEQVEHFEQAVKKEIASQFVVSTPWDHRGEARIVALIGPTGVGKTTTVAKLAANYSLLGGSRVGLVTVDTYRIAAVEQLKTYAEIIDVPVMVAYAPEEMPAALEALADCDLVLMDTAGRSQRNQEQMGELRGFLDMLPQVEVHLVVSATSHPDHVRDVLDSFGRLCVDSMVITKLDEARSYGMLLNLACWSGKPISYLTTGQQVPEDIEVAEAHRLASLVMGEEQC